MHSSCKCGGNGEGGGAGCAWHVPLLARCSCKALAPRAVLPACPSCKRRALHAHAPPSCVQTLPLHAGLHCVAGSFARSRAPHCPRARPLCTLPLLARSSHKPRCLHAHTHVCCTLPPPIRPALHTRGANPAPPPSPLADGVVFVCITPPPHSHAALPLAGAAPPAFARAPFSRPRPLARPLHTHLPPRAPLLGRCVGGEGGKATSGGPLVPYGAPLPPPPPHCATLAPFARSFAHPAAHACPTARPCGVRTPHRAP